MKKIIGCFALMIVCGVATAAQVKEKTHYGVFTTDNPMPYCDLIRSRPVSMIAYKTGTGGSHKSVAEFILEKKAKLMADAYTKGNAIVGYRIAIGVTRNGATVSMDGVAVLYDCTKRK